MDARQFFEDYGDAFLQTESEVAKFYAVPCLTARAGTAHLNATLQELEQFFASVLTLYHDKGFARGRIRSLHSSAVGESSVIATIGWEYLGTSGKVLWSSTFTYNLYKIDERWAILLQTMHD